MDVGDHGWSGEMALVDGQSNREQLTKSSSQRLKRHELMDHSTRSSSQSKLVKTGSRSQRRLVRKTKSKNADEASIIVDGDIQDKCAKHTIVF